MAEETLVKMVDNDGQTEEKIIKTSHTLTRTVKFPSKKEWKLADDEIVMSGEVFTGFFILEELDEPFAEVEDVATITKEGFLVVYESDCHGYMINLRQVKSVSMAGMPFSESSGKWFELMYVGICLLVEFGKIIIIAEKTRSSQWIQALGQFVPCDIEETVLFTLDGTDTEEEEEEEEQGDELETTGTEEEAEETDGEEESQSEKTLPSVSGHHTELETISEDEEEEEKDAILESSGQSSATHNTM